MLSVSNVTYFKVIDVRCKERHLLLKLLLATFHMAYLLFLTSGHLYLTRQSVPKWQIKGLECV